MTLFVLSTILSVKSNRMGKACCAVGCSNRFIKGSGVHFYRSPQDEDLKSQWIAAVGRKGWIPNEYSWICSVHFVSGEKSNNLLSPDYVPSLFEHMKSPLKRKRVHDMNRFHRTLEVKKRKLDEREKMDAAESLLQLSEPEANYSNLH